MRSHPTFATLATVGSLLAMTAAGDARAEAPVLLESRSLAVSVDPAFPRIVQYQSKASGAKLGGQPTPVSTVELNGAAAPCQISFRKVGPARGEYRLVFPEAAVEIALHVTVGEDVVDLRAASIEERGSVKVRTFGFPGSALLTVSSAQPDASIAATHSTCVADDYRGSFREKIGPLASMEPGSDTGNYFFLSAGALAAGIAGNHPVDIERAAWTVAESNGVKTCAAGCPSWRYREIDTETVDLPWTRVFVTGDRNGDGRADWQDAALAYRANMPKPFGSEFVRTTVGENIAMNFASGAQQPFLRILDNVKKCFLATDGLGQQVLIKGFSAEGHDSANTDCGGHYNERAGGLKDFTVLLDRAPEHNARIGIHINASEVYPEAHRYKPEILQRDANGNPKGGWSWLDHAQMIDKRKDLLTGNLFASLDQMHRELPGLDFVYVDTYWEHGWPAWKIAGKLASMGLPMYTEGDLPLDPWTTWAHWRGSGSAVMRFLWYSERDIFNNDPLLRGGRGDDDGFMGWQNQHSFHNFIRSTFTRHLPATYLKRFELLRWEPGKEAVFSDGVKVAKDGDNVTVTQDGRVVMKWTGGGTNSRLFVPWDAKLYVWDETGGAETWDLPPSWKQRSEVYLYRLTDQGRTNETRIPVNAGKVTLTVDKAAPYVLYPRAAPLQKQLVWGEGSLVKDPGFDSHGFAAWKAGGDVRIENDGRGNSRLVLSGMDGAAGEVSQVIGGLEPGRTYAASAWAQSSGRRTVSIVVQPAGGTAVSNYAARTNVRHSAPNDPRTGTSYQRLKVLFDIPPGCTRAILTLRAERSSPGVMAEFDDIRMVKTERSPEAAKHWFYEDFEHVDMGYGPFTCCPGERTHLSEANPPYTQDVIHGRYSLKSRDGGRVLRTLPSTLRFKPNTRYRIGCETIGQGRLALESKGSTVWEQKFPGDRGRVDAEFATRGDAECFLSLYRDGGDSIVIDDLFLDELGPAPVTAEATPADDRLPGRSVLLEENFTKPLDADWRVIASVHPGTTVGAGDGALEIVAAANVSALVERKLPAGVTAVECLLNGSSDGGQTWGSGLALLWASGQAIRVNLRGPDGRFGVDSTTAAQAMAGQATADGPVVLRLRLESDTAIAEARNEDGGWQTLATYPREKFPGDPTTLRIGKMHAVEGVDDHTDPGPGGSASIERLRVYGR
jgi:endo-alpha-N-acetylgalactosaminidase